MFDDDGCTFWFNVWRGINVRYCCDAHDTAYASTHTAFDWLAANWALLQCGVAAGVPIWALAAFLGVMSPIGAWLYFMGSKVKKENEEMAILERGAKGAAVKQLQQQLVAVGAKLNVDSDFGLETERAVRGFQASAGLVSDGKVGPMTRTALRSWLAPVVPGREEPIKLAIDTPLPPAESPAPSAEPAPPPNARSLQLLDTARPIKEIIFHCAATPEWKDYTVADIRAWHKARGWSDIGYHYVVYRDGTIMPGRPIGQIGSHVAGHNTGTIGICYVGGLTASGETAKDTRTPAQRASMLWLAAKLAKKFPGITRISGHNEYAAKACPCFHVPSDPLGQIAA